jgi:Transposase DDE domain
MVTENHPLMQLLNLVDEIWVQPESKRGRGAPKTYSEQVMFKVYLVSLMKRLWQCRSLWRYLSETPRVARACGLICIPHRRTLDRRLSKIAPYAEQQIRHLGLMLSVEMVTNGTVAASDGSAFKTPGPVWHKKDKEASKIPRGLTGLDQEADWIQSSYHGWVYGYKAHVTISVSSATVRAVLDATVTGSACESHVLESRIDTLPPTIDNLLLDAGYDDINLITHCEQRGIEVLVPLSKPVGKSTSQARKDRAIYLLSPQGKSRYRQRGSSIEPFFATIKDFFKLSPLPVQGKTKASAYILLALYTWNLIVLFNFINDRPLGAVKSILELM